MEQVQNLQASSSSSFGDEALSILIGMDPTQGHCDSIIGSVPDPPDSAAAQYNYPSGGSVGRKLLPKIGTCRRVRVQQVVGDSDSPPDDGYTWRKYGKNCPSGAEYPRSYYTCIHRRSRGCMAKRTTRRLDDDDPGVLEIVYKFKHTCQGPSHVPSPPLLRKNMD